LTTYTFTGAVAYDRLGSSWRTAAGLRSVSVTDPATGLLPANLVQGGVAVSWLTADANSRYSFTCDVPGVVVDFGAGAEALYANEVPGMAIAAGGVTSAQVDARMKWAPATAYTLGQQILSPNNDVVSAIAAHTSGATYAAANWTLSSTYDRRRVFNVKSYGATGDGVTDDTAAIAACIAAAHASTGATLYLNAVAYFPDGIFLSDQINLDGLKVTLIGAGSQTTTIKAKTGQTDYLIKCPGTWAALAPNNLWRTRMGGFKLQGTSAAAASTFVPADATAVSPGGLKLDFAGSIDLFDVSAREFGGPGLWLKNVILSRFSNIVLNRPVGADTNAVPYFYSMGWCNENSFNDLLFQSLVTTLDGPAVVWIDQDSAYASMNQGRWSGTQFEFMHTPSNGAIWDVRSSTTVFRDSLYEDCVPQATPVNTSVMRMRGTGVSGGLGGGNLVTGLLRGNAGNYQRGVLVEQSGNVIDGAVGGSRFYVEIASGVNYTAIFLKGAPFTGFADSVIDSSGTTTNVVMEASQGGMYVGAGLSKWGDTLRNYYVTFNTKGDVSPLAKFVGKVPGASVLWVQTAASPTQPYINFVNSAGTPVSSVNRFGHFVAPVSTTAARASAVTAGAGASYYDTTLSKPGFSDGTVWRDAAGTAI